MVDTKMILSVAIGVALGMIVFSLAKKPLKLDMYDEIDLD